MGGYGFLFRSEFFFRTTQELEYLFFLSRNFFPDLTLGYMTKTLNQIIFFPPPKSEYFFQQHWESEYFFRKKTITSPPPFKLNGRSLRLSTNGLDKHQKSEVKRLLSEYSDVFAQDDLDFNFT